MDDPMHPPHDRPVGQHTLLGGRYRLDARIAAGGMGEVWSATDGVLGRVVAVKLLKRELLDEPGFLARFRAEARHAAALTHPGIAGVYDYGEDRHVAYLVMELVDGRTLSALLATEGALAPARAASILAQTCAALAAAHAAGVVHRDVKPGNVMLTSDGRVKITDFGISKLVGAVPLTETGQVLGTPQYISPEQATGSSGSTASDIYSLGVIGYEMLAGRRPFVGDTPVAIAMAHVHTPPPPLPATVPAELAATIGSMLAKQPADRPADAAALGHRFATMPLADAPEGGASSAAARAVGAAAAASPVAAASAIAPAHTGPTVLHTAVRPAASAMDPPTVLAPPQPTERFVAPVRRRSPVLYAFAAVLVLVALAAIVLARRGADDDRLGEVSAGSDVTTTTPVSAAAVAVTVPPPETVAATTIPPTTLPPTTVAPTVVTIDPAAFIGLDHTDARRQLEGQGFEVREEKVRGGGEKNTVVDVRIEPRDGSPGLAILSVSDGKDAKDEDD